jgi:hypothetical protein
VAKQEQPFQNDVFIRASHQDEGWVQEAIEYHEERLAIWGELGSPRAEEARERLEKLEGNYHRVAPPTCGANGEYTNTDEAIRVFPVPIRGRQPLLTLLIRCLAIHSHVQLKSL